VNEEPFWVIVHVGGLVPDEFEQELAARRPAIVSPLRAVKSPVHPVRIAEPALR